MTNLEAMLAEHDLAAAGFDELYTDETREPEIRARYDPVRRALLEARPTEPAALLAWFRWLIDDLQPEQEHRQALEHVAKQLEEMVRSRPS
jgi:hypothetical protein